MLSKDKQLSEKILEDFIRIDEKLSDEASKHANNFIGEYTILYYQFLLKGWYEYMRSN